MPPFILLFGSTYCYNDTRKAPGLLCRCDLLYCTIDIFKRRLVALELLALALNYRCGCLGDKALIGELTADARDLAIGLLRSPSRRASSFSRSMTSESGM